MNIQDLHPEQLSMMASALAVGESFCCSERARGNRETVVQLRDLPASPHVVDSAVEEFAYGSMGCGHEDLVPIADLENPAEWFEPTNKNRNEDRARARHFLQMFFEATGCRYPRRNL